MLLRIAVAIALVIGTAQAAEPVLQLRGESTASYLCRAAHVPEARQCASRCAATYGADEADARWECVHSCTTRGLWAMSECRAQGGPVSVTTLATR